MNIGQSKIKSLAIILSLILVLMMTVQLVVVKRWTNANNPLDIGDYSSYDVVTVEKTYTSSPTNDNLLLLLKVLCYKAKVEENLQVGTLIKHYGSEIFKRAKDDTIDLSTVDDEEVITQIIEILRYYGAS